jgi:PHP family Zn ribbon phosphoesterase
MINGHNITMNGVVAKGGIYDLHCGMIEDYDYEIWMSDLSALQLATSTKPTTTFVTMWRTGQIKIHPNGTGNAQKLAYADQLVAQDNEAVPLWIRQMFGAYIKQ